MWALDAQVAGCGLGSRTQGLNLPALMSLLPQGWFLGAEAETAVGSCVDSSLRRGCSQELGLRGCGVSPLHLGVDDAGILGEGAHR